MRRRKSLRRWASMAASSPAALMTPSCPRMLRAQVFPALEGVSGRVRGAGDGSLLLAPAAGTCLCAAAPPTGGVCGARGWWMRPCGAISCSWTSSPRPEPSNSCDVPLPTPFLAPCPLQVGFSCTQHPVGKGRALTAGSWLRTVPHLALWDWTRRMAARCRWVGGLRPVRAFHLRVPCHICGARDCGHGGRVRRGDRRGGSQLNNQAGLR